MRVLGRFLSTVATDQLILMVRRRVADLWRQAAAVTPDSVNWADLYRQLLGELTQLAGADAVSDSECAPAWRRSCCRTSSASHQAVPG